LGLRGEHYEKGEEGMRGGAALGGRREKGERHKGAGRWTERREVDKVRY